MLTSGRNKSAETAYAMALKLLGAEKNTTSNSSLAYVWGVCHDDQELQRLVDVYLYSTPSYAPKALHKVHTKLMELFGEWVE